LKSRACAAQECPARQPAFSRPPHCKLNPSARLPASCPSGSQVFDQQSKFLDPYALANFPASLYSRANRSDERAKPFGSRMVFLNILSQLLKLISYLVDHQHGFSSFSI